jgi:hypothetical protein
LAAVLDPDRLACFAAAAQAEGVSLPGARRLLATLLRQRTPSVPQLGRRTQAAARKADALLPVRDAVARPGPNRPPPMTSSSADGRA